jgi:hypothetical protein
MSLTRSYVEKLIAVRDAYERKQGPDDDMDKLVRDTLKKMSTHATGHGEIQTANWCHEQLANEKHRTALHPESLVPSGMVGPRRSIGLQEYLQEYGVHPLPGSRSSGRPMMNPFSNRPSQLPDFVSANPHVPGHRNFGPRGGSTRTNKGKKGKKGKKSIRRGKH